MKSNEKLDKDRFRCDLGGLLEAYAEVAKRLGIMGESEPPCGVGPVLVKGRAVTGQMRGNWIVVKAVVVASIIVAAQAAAPISLPRSCTAKSCA